MRSEDTRHEIFASGLEAPHFYFKPYRALYAATQERYYADDPIDPLSISEAVGPRIATDWGITEREAVDRVLALSRPDPADTTTATEHAKVIKRHSDYRELLTLVSAQFDNITQEKMDPEAIAGALSAAALRIVTSSLAKHEVLDYASLGRRWVKAKNEEIAARAAGVELGAWFGIKGMDAYLKGAKPTELIILGGDPGIGKHLTLDTPLPTPAGWTTMGDVRCGDLLYDELGRPTRVMAASQVEWFEDVYELTFNDGATVKASGTHTWIVSSRRGRSAPIKQAYRLRNGTRKRPPDPVELEEVTTRQIVEHLYVDDGERANYAIQVAEPLDGEEMELPLDPYILGVWLAEGSTNAARLGIGDLEIIDILRKRGADVSVRQDPRKDSDYREVGLRGATGIRALRAAGVLGNKHIPTAYLRAAADQRWALLAGIADGDGWCDDGGCEITTVLPRLRDDLFELVTSLGCIVFINEGRAQLNGKDYGPKWNVRFQSKRSPFWIARKANGWTPPRFDARYIVGARQLPSEPVRCVAVESSSALYLCGRAMIPTHNTAISAVMARNFALRQMKKPADRRIGTLYMSLEMGEEQSSDRFAQFIAGVDGERLRLGTLTKAELRDIAQQWAGERELPLYANFSGELRETQLRAIVVNAIQRHNVGLVIIDHMRFIKTDEHFRDRNDADEQIVKFLKATLAKDLNLVVICLAHTTKSPQEKRRPVMDDLRGSKMISAFADFVVFPYWPWRYATQEQRERGQVEREAYELVFDKARGGATGIADLYIDFSRMIVR